MTFDHTIDEATTRRVVRVQGTVLHVADCATHEETCVSVEAVTRVEVHPGGAGA